MAGPNSTSGSPSVRSGAPSPAQNDWTTQIADTIESVVSSVRDKTTIPLETVARAAVYGILIAAMGFAALVLTTIAVVRASTYIPGAEVWMAYAALGGFFTLLGMFLWRKRRPRRGAGADRER